jgi:hypothetical protein
MIVDGAGMATTHRLMEFLGAKFQPSYLFPDPEEPQ